MLLKRFIQIFILLIWTAPVFAQIEAAKTRHEIGHGAHLTEVFLTLLLVIGCIFFMAWLFKRVGHHQFSQNSILKVKACLPLSTKEKLLLVEVGEEQLLIGIAPGCIRKLKTLKNPVSGFDNQTKQDFSSTLNQLLKGKSFQKSTLHEK